MKIKSNDEETEYTKCTSLLHVCADDHCDLFSEQYIFLHYEKQLKELDDDRITVHQ